MAKSIQTKWEAVQRVTELLADNSSAGQLEGMELKATWNITANDIEAAKQGGAMKEVVIEKNVSGEYECKGVSEAGNTVKFLVPVSTFSKILEHIDPDIFEAMIRSLFEAKFDQHREGQPVDLGTLDSREVDGLFSDIRAKKRREAGGWSKGAGGTGR
jgi:hypothetical protein